MEEEPDVANFDLLIPCFKNSSKEERDKILAGRNSESTNKATKSILKIFAQYGQEKNIPSLDEISEDNLPDILFTFYLYQQDGAEYKLSSIKCIRAGLNRHLKETRNIDIIADVWFTKTNELFCGVAAKARKEGCGCVSNFPVIEDEDLKQIGDYFAGVETECNPKKLQNAVMFCIMYHLCHRGHQNMTQLKMSTFDIGTNEQGKKFIFQVKDEMDKNHKEDTTDAANEGKMYENPGE